MDWKHDLQRHFSGEFSIFKQPNIVAREIPPEHVSDIRKWAF
jgi:hypothetical protein